MRIINPTPEVPHAPQPSQGSGLMMSAPTATEFKKKTTKLGGVSLGKMTDITSAVCYFISAIRNRNPNWSNITTTKQPPRPVVSQADEEWDDDGWGDEQEVLVVCVYFIVLIENTSLILHHSNR